MTVDATSATGDTSAARRRRRVAGSLSAGLQRFSRCAAAALIAVVTASLPGCSEGNPAPLVSPVAPIIDINSQTALSVSDGGTLRLAMSSFPLNFNPLCFDSSVEYVDIV